MEYLSPIGHSVIIVISLAGATDKTDTSMGKQNGVRSIRVSPSGEDLASGDRLGNIRIYDMKYLEEKRSIEAHESDVMCLEYTETKSGGCLFV